MLRTAEEPERQPRKHTCIHAGFGGQPSERSVADGRRQEVCCKCYPSDNITPKPLSVIAAQPAKCRNPLVDRQSRSHTLGSRIVHRRANALVATAELTIRLGGEG